MDRSRCRNTCCENQGCSHRLPRLWKMVCYNSTLDEERTSLFVKTQARTLLSRSLWLSRYLWRLLRTYLRLPLYLWQLPTCSTNTAYHLPYSAGSLSQGSSTFQQFQQFQLFQHWLNTSATVNPASNLTPTQAESIPSQPVQLKRLRDEAEEPTGEKGSDVFSWK